MPSTQRRCLQLLTSIFIICAIYIHPSAGLQVEGYWSPSSSPLKVVARFGIQKSEANHKDETSGYAFGNVTLISHPSDYQLQSSSYNDNQSDNAVMLFVNRTLFKQIYHIYLEYKSENVADKNNISKHQDTQKLPFCGQIYRLVQDKFYDPKCIYGNVTSPGLLDFVRYVPCPKNKSCNEPSKVAPFPSSQFTYVVDNRNEPTFWFLIFLSCQKNVIPPVSKNNSNINCTWTSTTHLKSLIAYDIWFVNGHPNGSSNPLTDWDHQFSFEQQNLFVYIVLNISYLILLILQLYALSIQKVRGLNWLFTISLSLQCLAYFFFCMHKIVFAHNGKGFETLHTFAEIMKIMSTALFILYVLMIAKGYPISKQEIFSKTMLLIIWAIYIVIKILLFIWIKGSLNFIEEVDEYHTVPGWISLGFRILLMLWFLHELRHTMILEHDARKLRFYLHFGAGILVWFVHLPLVAMVALQIDLMWRYKIITGFSSAADVFAYAVVTRLMLQTKHNQLVTHQAEMDDTDDLDYYDDHSSSETIKFSKAKYRAQHSYDNLSCDKNPIKA